MIQIENSVVLITGACGGIGSSLVDEFIIRKARKIYAAGLNIEALNQLVSRSRSPDKIVPVKLDVTSAEDLAAITKKCQDITILVNNAGVECATQFVGEKSLKAAQLEMNVNYFGVHNLCQYLWSVLDKKKNACIVNMLSIGSFTLVLKLGTYCASKSAAHFLTQALRQEAVNTAIKIVGVYPGYVDTDMTKNIEVEKVTPIQIAAETCDGIEAGEQHIFPDPMSKKLAENNRYATPIFSEFDA